MTINRSPAAGAVLYTSTSFSLLCWIATCFRLRLRGFRFEIDPDLDGANSLPSLLVHGVDGVSE